MTPCQQYLSYFHTRRSSDLYRRASAIAKVDFVINQPVPWAVPAVGEAATVHLGGTQAEMFAAEATVARGQHAPHPMVLVSDPAVVDPSRTVAGLRPLWAYAHVPRSEEHTSELQSRGHL